MKLESGTVNVDDGKRPKFEKCDHSEDFYDIETTHSS